MSITRFPALVSTLIAASLTMASWFSPANASDPAPQSSDAFPKAWLGRWKGDVEIVGAPPGATVPKFTKELVIAPTDVAGQYTWTIIYQGSAGNQTRPYTLITKDAAQGLYEIDEKNGIVLPARLLAGVLHTNFIVEGSRIVTREELLDPGTPNERILAELSSYTEADPKTTGGNGTPDVKGWTPSTIQRAILRKVPETQPDSHPAKPASTLAQGEKPAPAPDAKPDAKPAAKAPPTGRDALTASPASWTRFKTETYQGKQDDVFFISPNLGWYVNGAGKIFKTTDAGTTWTQKLHKPGTYFRCIAFVDENVGFAGNIGPGYFPNVTDTVPLYETRDGGDTWNPVTSIDGEPVVGLCALEVVKIPFINAGNLDHKTRIVGVGRVGGPTAFIMSDDLGKSWKQLPLPPSCAMAFDVHFFDDRHGVIASATSTNVQESKALILTTDDAGATWREAYIGQRPFELTWKIAFPSRDTGYVTIQSYNPDPATSARFVAKTTDGGKTWAELPLVDDLKVRQFGVAFIDENRGWIGAAPGGFETTDGGKTWLKSDMGNAVNKIRIVRNGDKAHLYAIGVNVSTLALP